MSPLPFGHLFLFGSGETSPVASRIFNRLATESRPRPVIAVVETPAGFQPNSKAVAAKVADFIAERFTGKEAVLHLIAARRRDTPDSPDDPRILEPIRGASLIFLGPGSPTYAVRQLSGSLAWTYILAAWQSGAHLVLASAAAIAAGYRALPVYEIFKAGADLQWQPGLDLLGGFGLRVVMVPHWNNQEGGAELDTSHCFMGRGRFEELRRLLPPETVILGIEEHTAVELIPERSAMAVHGKGRALVLAAGGFRTWAAGAEFALSELGATRIPQEPFGTEPHLVEEFRAVREKLDIPSEPPPEVMTLVRERDRLRGEKNFAGADALRVDAERLGWKIEDTPQGGIARPRR